MLSGEHAVAGIEFNGIIIIIIIIIITTTTTAFHTQLSNISRQRLQSLGRDSVRIPRRDKHGVTNEDGAEYVVYDPQQVSHKLQHVACDGGQGWLMPCV